MRRAESYFAKNPTSISKPRSKLDRSHSHTTSFQAGLLIPIMWDEILPGDSVNLSCSKLVRMSTLVTPVIGNIYLDTFWFFVPRRLVWSHWREFMGENTQSAWLPQTTYSIPQLYSPQVSGVSVGWSAGTIADYMGVPIKVPNLSLDALPFRAYGLIWNEFFRDENLQDPIPLSLGDSNIVGYDTTASSTAVNLLQGYYRGGYPAPVNKYHDAFTSALPAPQRGPDTTISVTSGGLLPVFAMDDNVDLSTLPRDSNDDLIPARFINTNDGTTPTVYNLSGVSGSAATDPAYYAGNAVGMDPGTNNIGQNETGFLPVNLYAGDSGSLTVATVNQLRMAFQIQKYLEASARGGSRYIESILVHFGIRSPDARLQRPEYLGGSRIPIRVMQVVQQSETGNTPQGNLSGMSLTTDKEDAFVKSFTEHGFIFGLCAVRYFHSYQQGVPREFSRRTIYDFYTPEFAALGEVGIKNKEIYAQGTSADEEIFGYQEAWYEYRYKQSVISGQMRSAYSASLDSWHLGDYYASQPYLSSDWIKEDASVIDRCLAVSSSVSHQFIADFYFKNIITRVMPTYSIPGLIDHF